MKTFATSLPITHFFPTTVQQTWEDDGRSTLYTLPPGDLLKQESLLKMHVIEYFRNL